MSDTVVFWDLGRHCACAHDGPNPGVPLTSVVRLPAPEGDVQDGYDYGPTFTAFRKQASAVLTVLQPRALGYEAPLQVISSRGAAQYTNQHSVFVLFGLSAHLEQLADEHHVRCYQTHNQTIKKFFAGTGRADKAAMLARCRQLNWDVGGSADRADAAAGWAHLRSLLDPAFAIRSTPLFARWA